MAIEFEVSEVLPAPPEVLYRAWLDSDEHSRMTGASASASDQLGAEFSAWAGYIEGRNLELEQDRRIVQSWRTSEFEDTKEDSRLEVLFEPHPDGTLVTVRHSNLPDHGMQYQQGWIDSYFTPMRSYFQVDE